MPMQHPVIGKHHSNDLYFSTLFYHERFLYLHVTNHCNVAATVATAELCPPDTMQFAHCLGNNFNLLFPYLFAADGTCQDEDPNVDPYGMGGYGGSPYGMGGYGGFPGK
jgi:hypothetical protein